jgi:linoleoyl-CoA desaturase
LKYADISAYIRNSIHYFIIFVISMHNSSSVRFVSQNSDKDKFFSTLRQRVQAYFKQNNISSHATFGMYVKTLFMLSLYLVPFALIYAQIIPAPWLLWLAYAAMGFGVVGIGMSIMHDAIHQSYSEKGWINRVLGYSLNLVGGSDFTWKVQHNHLHHTYTNIYGIDEDIDDKPILRLSPWGKWQSLHRFQHVYACFMYMLATISWVLMKDIKQIIRYNRTGLTRELGHSPAWEAFVIIANKLFYFTVTLVLPLVLLDYAWWHILVGFLIMHFIAGFVMTLVFQLAHVVEPATYPKMNDSGNIENTWAIHQLETTADFAQGSKFLSWCVGGLNFQVEHHLFPQICHVHYPEVAKIVRSTAKEFGITYNEFPTLWSAITSHFAALKSFGESAAAPHAVAVQTQNALAAAHTAATKQPIV